MKTFAVVMISCDKRSLREDTLARFADLGLGRPIIVMDTMACENQGLTVIRPQERQERVSKMALELGIEQETDYILFLEDDLDFNRELAHNLQAWGPIADGTLDFGSLYNPTVVGDDDASPQYQNTRVANPDKVYGSQAFVLSRKFAQYCVENWDTIPGMQDIKISRLAATLDFPPLYYHSPSLVQHMGMNSAWTDDNRFHQAPDFSPDWKA